MKITSKLVREDWRACKDGADWFDAQFPEGETTFAELIEKFDRADWFIWTLDKTEKYSKRQFVWLAALCGEQVLKLYEDKYPDDKRPRLAIEAAKAYALDPSEKNREAAAWAARAATVEPAAEAARAAARAATVEPASWAATAASWAALWAAAAALWAGKARAAQHKSMCDMIRVERKKKSFKALK